jgi:hypothetical protein
VNQKPMSIAPFKLFELVAMRRGNDRGAGLPAGPRIENGMAKIPKVRDIPGNHVVLLQLGSTSEHCLNLLRR